MSEGDDRVGRAAGQHRAASSGREQHREASLDQEQLREASLDQEQLREASLRALFEALQAAPWQHDFFALLRRIECLRPDAPRFGQALRPSQEALRLGQDAELDFAPAALATFGIEGGAVPRLGVRFFGLLGSHGPLPLHLTEYIRERQRFRNDPTAARFLDIFHHRMLTLFYRAWSQTQPTVQHDRPQDDRFKAWLGATFGLAKETRTQGTLPETARLFQAGLLGSRSRHPEGLTKLLSQHFGVAVRIQSNIAHWLPIDLADRSRLGFARNRPERAGQGAAALGKSANAGARVCDRQYKFRIVIGPLTQAQYHGFLPGGAAWRQLRDWVHQYVGIDLLWDVQLSLAQAQVPEPRLGRQVALGVASWLVRRSSSAEPVTGGRPGAGAGVTRDRDDLRLRPQTSFLLRHGVANA